MPTKVSTAAAAKISKLRRYVTYVGHTKSKGFYVKVADAARSRPHRVLHLTGAAKAALGERTIRVGLRGKQFTARVLRRSLRQKALALAASQIGTTESPANSNLTKYGAWYGMNGQPWCAIFISWVLSRAGHSFRQSYVPTIVALARSGQQGLSVVSFEQVSTVLRRGHVVLACYDWPGESPGMADHVGFVRDVVDSINFHAIEGNTAPSSAGNQSNGGEVCLKLRPKTDVQAFVKVG